MLSQFAQTSFWEWPQGDGAEQSHLDALMPEFFHGSHAYTCSQTVAYEYDVGILCLVFLVSDFLLLYLVIFLVHLYVSFFHQMRIQFERGHDAVLTFLQSQSVCGPRTLLLDFLIGAPWSELGQYAFFHHLSDGSVAEYHDRCSPLEHQLLGQSHHISHFLYIAGSQYDDMIITIATSVYSLKVI